MTLIWAISAVIIFGLHLGLSAFVLEEVLPKFPKILEFIDKLIERI